MINPSITPPPFPVDSNTTITPPPFPPPTKPDAPNGLFARHGRMGRLSLLAAMFAALALYAVTFLGVFVIVSWFNLDHGPITVLGYVIQFGLTTIILLTITTIALLSYLMILYRRRLHDLDHSGWWALIPIALLVIDEIVDKPWTTILVLLSTAFLLCAPGNKAANRFGTPRTTSGGERVFGWIFAILYALSCAYSLYDMITDKKPAASTERYKAPYPLTSAQLWQKMLVLTGVPNGVISHEQIETAFAIKMDDSIEPIIGKIYRTKAGQDWYFMTRLSHMSVGGHDMQIFNFNWVDTISKNGTPPPAGMCINVNDVSPSLLAQGWRLNAPDASINDGFNIKYKQHNISYLMMTYDPQHCMTHLQLMIDKNEFVIQQDDISKAAPAAPAAS
jgi:uncharacterized membrane protein YhaH (DUF805 family)